MNVLNIHQRAFTLPPGEVGALIDSLSSQNDLLWPGDLWPPMAFDRSLSVGATGGHGPIRYRVEEYQPGKSIRFRFLGPAGFDGWHGFDVLSDPADGTILRHTVDMRTSGPALLSWPVLFRPLHDALMEDALARAQASLGQDPTVVKWPAWVRLLRWVFTAGKARPQHPPRTSPGTDSSHTRDN